jgi:hypothetical protein
MMSANLELPETRVNNDNPPIYALPSWCISLGAYPVLTAKSLSGIHRTYRKGMREFNHDFFSRLYIDEDKANFQLHTWEYLIADRLVGYIVSESLTGLSYLKTLAGYGCKLGKEGFAFIEAVSPPLKLENSYLRAHPSMLVPMDDLLASNEFVGGCDIYNLYRYQWRTESSPPADSWEVGLLDDNPTAIDGFTPFVSAYFHHHDRYLPELDYYTNGEINIPVSLVNFLRGGINV